MNTEKHFPAVILGAPLGASAAAMIALTEAAQNATAAARKLGETVPPTSDELIQELNERLGPDFAAKVGIEFSEAERLELIRIALQDDRPQPPTVAELTPDWAAESQAKSAAASRREPKRRDTRPKRDPKAQKAKRRAQAKSRKSSR